MYYNIVNLEDILLSKMSVTKDIFVWFHLCKFPKVVKQLKAEWWLFPGDRRWGNGKLLFSEFRVSVLEDEKVSEDRWWWKLYNNVTVFIANELNSTPEPKTG